MNAKSSIETGLLPHPITLATLVAWLIYNPGVSFGRATALKVDFAPVCEFGVPVKGPS